MKFEITNIPAKIQALCNVVTQEIDSNSDGNAEKKITIDFREAIAMTGGIILAGVLLLQGYKDEALALGTTVVGYGIGRSVPQNG